MPMYEFECPDCGERAETYTSMLHVEPLPWPCLACVGAMTWVPSCPTIRPDTLGYYDEGLGKFLDSRTQRSRIMREQGVEEVGTSERHGARGIMVSFPGEAASSVAPSGAYARKGRP